MSNRAKGHDRLPRPPIRPTIAAARIPPPPAPVEPAMPAVPTFHRLLADPAVLSRLKAACQAVNYVLL